MSGLLETPLWSGRPDLRSLARGVWRIRLAAFYFGVLLADGAWACVRDPSELAGEEKLAAMSLFTLLILALLAWATHRTTRYDITKSAIVLSFGLALPCRLVIPFGAVAEAKLRVHRDGTGDLALRLREAQSVMYLKLWPHVRALSFLRAEPMLLSLREPGTVGALLCRAMAADEAARALSVAGDSAAMDAA